MTTPKGLKIEAVVPFEGMDHVALAIVCVNIAEKVGIPTQELKIYGRPLFARRIKSQLKSRKSFLIESDGLQAHLACITDFRIGLLTVIGLTEGAFEDCIMRVSMVSPVISARWIDAEYDHWQNAEDPLLYQVAGRAMEGLPMKSNDLPPPLDQMILDISHNPGRRILRDGYVEAIGYRMWLGQEFFRRVPGSSREAVLSIPWLKITELSDDILEIVAHAEPFVDDSTADLQNRLRRLLFPTTVK